MVKDPKAYMAWHYGAKSPSITLKDETHKKNANRDFETIKVQRSCFIAFECITALNPTYAWIEKVSHSVTICHVQYTLSANMH